MKQVFLIQKQHPCLLVFFAGWGMDENPFRNYAPAGCDFMICYDYRSLDFDETLMKPYTSVRLIAWSMGVWAASQVLDGRNIHFDECVAVNGTIYPVDDQRGIPTAIFNGTLDGLDEANYRKFIRRMCCSAESFTDFIQVAPRRTIQELKDELQEIGKYAVNLPATDFKWDRAIIGSKDRIFSPENQTKGWEGTEISIKEAGHYSAGLWEELFR